MSTRSLSDDEPYEGDRAEVLRTVVKKGGNSAGTVSYAKATRLAKKGEDYAVELVGDRVSAVAVFDGHSGPSFAEACSKSLCQGLIEAAPFRPTKVVDSFWELDQEVGSQPGERSGATAQVLFVEQVEGVGGTRFKCTVAWCGDSTLVVTDMNTGRVLYHTTNHTAGPDHQGEDKGGEARRLMLDLCRVRSKLEAVCEIDTQHDVVEADHVSQALAALAEDSDEEAPPWGEDEKALLVRACGRARLISAAHPDGSHRPGAAATRKLCHVRQRDPNHDLNRTWVVATASTRSEPHYHDLQMTRSLGDWLASEMVLPHPQLHEFTVPYDAHMRVIVATDGLWDVCSYARAAAIAASSATCARAASRLIRTATDEYLQRRGHFFMDDDTTVTVVDLVPNGTPVVPAGSSSCCALV